MKKCQLKSFNPLLVAASSCPVQPAQGLMQEESLAVLSSFITNVEVISACFSAQAVDEVFDQEPFSTESAEKCFLAFQRVS